MAKQNKFTTDHSADDFAEKKKAKRRRLKKEKKVVRIANKKNQNAIQDEKISSSTETDNIPAFTCPEIPTPDNSVDKRIKSTSYNLTSSEDKDIKSAYNCLWENYAPLQLIHIKGADWYCERPQEKHTPKVVIELPVRRKLKDLAARIYKNELQQYERVEDQGISSRDSKFNHHIMTHGTAKDKLAAHILMSTKSPLHSLPHFSKLVAIAASNRDSQINDVAKGLQQLVSVALLPKGLIARQFEEHDFHGLLLPLVKSNIRKAEKLLLLWYFEDQLRIEYQKLVNALQEIVKSGNENSKQKCVQLLLHLIGNHPHQETEQILQVLINKLGDLDKSVGNAVVFGIRKVLGRRAALKTMVTDICATFLYRANQRNTTVYRCMLLLQDVLYTKDDVALVQKMIKLYFGFFKACTKKGEVDSKLMSVILRGLNRALPFVRGQQGDNGTAFLDEQLNILYRMFHLVSFNISVQILQLLYHVHEGVDGPLTERYHRVLYGNLLCSELCTSSSVSAFLNLVFKTMNRMSSKDTLMAFTKRMLQMCQFLPANISIAMVYLLAEVCKDNPVMIKVLAPVAGIEIETDEEDSDHQVKSEEVEEEDVKVPAIVVDPLTKKQSSRPQDKDEDSDEEYFEDLDVAEDGHTAVLAKITAGECSGLVTNVDVNTNTDSSLNSVEPKNEEKKPSLWLHKNNAAVVVKQETVKTRYDPFNRNPTYCGVQLTSMWEFSNILRHFHPSVKIFAEKMLNQDKLDYTGDPLLDFTTMKFLDRFVSKNPKMLKDLQDAAGSRALGAKSQYSGMQKRTMNVTTEGFRKMAEDNVPEDAKFFHKYFTTYKNKKSKKKKADDEVEDDEFDEYLHAMGGKDGALQMPYDDDDELDDQWDFAAKAQKCDPSKDKDSSDDSESDDDSDENEGLGEESGDDDNDNEMSDIEDNFEMEGGEDGDLYLDQGEQSTGSDTDDEQQTSKKIKKLKESSKESKKSAKDKKSTKEAKHSMDASKEKKKKVKKSIDVKEKNKKRDREEETMEGENNDGWASLSDLDSDDEALSGMDDGGQSDDIGFNEEDVDFSDEDDTSSKKSNKRRKLDGFMGKITKASKTRSLDSMMMDADEFSRLLQQNETRAPAITSADFVNTGKTSEKQLKWERSNSGKARQFSSRKHAGAKSKNTKPKYRKK